MSDYCCDDTPSIAERLRSDLTTARRERDEATAALEKAETVRWKMRAALQQARTFVCAGATQRAIDAVLAADFPQRAAARLAGLEKLKTAAEAFIDGHGSDYASLERAVNEGRGDAAEKAMRGKEK